MSEYTIEASDPRGDWPLVDLPGKKALSYEIVDTSPVVLMERENTGILVELVLVNGELDIRVTVAGDVTSARIPRDRGLDAFDHPYCYLPR